ncbi:hypothetical protein HOLleu_40347 [Holothuria leucospilota]|uniref:Uncharacterized protein n=1 Tax=Holothuria leucospilota TaxID=206669 RepID=A0A9Q1BAG3_HOLLE|nr:hypothetical protein HOLleu_40347 [Holothuria leucospilota]
MNIRTLYAKSSTCISPLLSFKEFPFSVPSLGLIQAMTWRVSGLSHDQLHRWISTYISLHHSRVHDAGLLINTPALRCQYLYLFPRRRERDRQRIAGVLMTKVKVL